MCHLRKRGQMGLSAGGWTASDFMMASRTTSNAWVAWLLACVLAVCPVLPPWTLVGPEAGDDASTALACSGCCCCSEHPASSGACCCDTPVEDAGHVAGRVARCNCDPGRGAGTTNTMTQGGAFLVSAAARASERAKRAPRVAARVVPEVHEHGARVRPHADVLVGLSRVVTWDAPDRARLCAWLL